MQKKQMLSSKILRPVVGSGYALHHDCACGFLKTWLKTEPLTTNFSSRHFLLCGAVAWTRGAHALYFALSWFVGPLPVSFNHIVFPSGPCHAIFILNSASGLAERNVSFHASWDRSENSSVYPVVKKSWRHLVTEAAYSCSWRVASWRAFIFLVIKDKNWVKETTLAKLFMVWLHGIQRLLNLSFIFTSQQRHELGSLPHPSSTPFCKHRWLHFHVLLPVHVARNRRFPPSRAPSPICSDYDTHE